MIAQDIKWCATVIHNASIRSKHRNQRLNRDLLIGDLFEFLPHFGVPSPFGDLELAELLNDLSEIESQIIYYSFILELTQREISNLLNISQQHVSKIKRRALFLLHKEVV